MRIIKLTNGILSAAGQDEIMEYIRAKPLYILTDGFTAFVNIVTDDGDITVRDASGKDISISDSEKAFDRMNALYVIEDDELNDILDEFGGQKSYVEDSSYSSYLSAEKFFNIDK